MKIHNKPFQSLVRPVIIACCKIRNVNLSSIARLASGSGIHEIIGLGFSGKVKSYVSRDAKIEVKNRSFNYLTKLKDAGYRIVALEQTDDSTPLPSFQFQEKTVIVVGNENHGVHPRVLEKVDDAIEIPMYGPPSCHNVAMATGMAVYEYCCQFPGE